MSCVFCDREPEQENGPHHILPKVVRRKMGWHGKRANECFGDHTVPLCGKCHVTLNALQEPLIHIIKYLAGRPPIPLEFAFIMDGVSKQLNHTLGETANENI